MKGHPTCRFSGSWIPMAMAAALTVAGCAPPTGEFDPGRVETLKVEMATYAVAVAFADPGGNLDSRAEQRLRDFVRLYMRRARGPLHVATAPGGDPSIAQARATGARDRLLAHGIDAADIVVDAGLSSASGETTVLLSFRGYRVIVPECGDWSGDVGFNPTNQPHVDFGCAYRRNTGLMVSDPGDLLKSGTPGVIDATRMGTVVGGYRVGGGGEEEE